MTGVDEANALADVHVYHAGTRVDDGRLVTAGGRVVAVTGRGSTLSDALRKAYAGVECIDFEGRQMRRDVGHHLR